MDKNKLFETALYEHTIEEIVNETSGKKKYILSGPFLVANTPNGNNRIYPAEISNKAIAKFREKVSQKRIKMSLDHPEWEGRIGGGGAAALLLEVTDVGPDNVARYRAQIMDTRNGKDLKAMVDAGALIGVSTRGRCTNIQYETSFPGIDGKFDVIGDTLEFANLDFVEEPSVERSEAEMMLENKQRSETMTFEELKAKYPEIFSNLQKTFESEKASLQTIVDDLTAKLTESNSKLGKLAEMIKDVNPDLFVTIPESKIVDEKNTELVKLTEATNSLKKELAESKTALENLQTEKEKVEKEKHLATLESKDPEYFKLPTLVALFENCVTVAECTKVYDANKSLMDAIKTETSNEAADPKTKVNGEGSTKAVKLDEARLADFTSRNEQRLNVGLAAMSEAEYLKKYCN